MNRTTTLIRGLGALTWLLLVLVAVPAALAVLGGNPLPSSVPSLGEVSSALTQPDDGSLLVATAVVIAWAAWASFALPLLLELVCSIGRVRVPSLPGLSFQQQRAGVTVAALTAMISLGGAGAATAANAPATAPSVSSSATLAAAPSSASTASTSQEATSGSTPDQASTDMHTVTEGETLWKIADEKLGDGSDYEQLVEASSSTVQPGGQRLSDPAVIQPGWKITVPEEQSSGGSSSSPSNTSDDKQDKEQSKAPAAETKPDSSTSDSSNDEEGKSSSAAATKPDRAEKQSPSPSATSTPAPTPSGQANGASEGSPLPSASSPQATSPSTAPREAGSAAAKPSPPKTSSPSTDQKSEASADQDTNWGGYLVAGGVGALLLAGMFTLIDRKRQRQSRRREVGHRIALPTGEAAITEAKMRSHADMATADELDRVARTLASYYASQGEALPALRAARLTPGFVELYLIDSTPELPEPFTRDENDPGVWLFDRELAEDHLLEARDAALIPAPWPALVTLGEDEFGGALLVNLEELGSLALHGPQPLDKEVLSALVIELLTGAWTDDARVTLCGVLPELVDALGSDRVSYNDDLDRVLTGLEYGARVHRGILEDDTSTADTSEQARITDAGEGDWTPQVIILGGEINDAQTRRLEQLVATRPRVAVATITTDDQQVGEWSLTVAYTEHSTTASLIGDDITLTLTPQRIPTAQFEHLLSISRTADEPDIDGPTWTEGITPSDAIDLDTVPAPDDPSSIELEDLVDAETVPDLPTPQDQQTENDDETVTQETATVPDKDLDDTPSATDQETTGEATPAPTDEPTHHDDEDEQHDHEEQREDATPETTAPNDDIRVLPGPDQPTVRLLGPIDVLGATGPRPSAPLRCVEVVAYLALHPGGSSADFTNAIFPGQRRDAVGPKRNQYMRNSRAWLGYNAAGQPWVGLVPDIGYALDPSTEVDWWRLQRLIGDTIGTAPTDNLTAALRLVDGQPMSFPDEHRYTWADADKTEIIATVVDIAHELATRSITSGDPRTATWATLKGLDADPTNEALWRMRITAAHQTGDPTQATNAITACRNTLDDLGDLDTTTHDLINTVLTNA